ncbi:MAG TPA: 2-oxoacid:acceptor oxidoreductase family protein [Candidatus Xenobia bacterium]|nr:2-oxoacid:acceptor oxidoreductase family protein [Candidatus Xenobia bacterium]
MSTTEIQFAGLGGQGVILAGMTVGRGLALYEDYHVSLTQSFGPEARGSACSVQLIVSTEPVHYPYVSRPHILAALSQEAYRRFAPKLHEGGILLLEEELVQAEDVRPDVRVYRVPATRLAEELGRKMVLNMVLVGFFTAITGLLRPDSACRAVAELVPPGTEALNRAAFDKGYQYGLAQLAGSAVAV